MAKFIKKIGRAAYKASGYKNPFKKGKLSTSRIIKQIPKVLKDVSIMKQMINSEKFRLETKKEGLGVAQLNNNNSGHYIYDVTPVPSQGDGYNNRQGNSIKLHSTHYDFFFQKQSANQGPIKVIIELFSVVGEPYSNVSSGVINKIFESNQWIDTTAIYDTTSNRKQEQFKNFRCLRRKVVYFKANDYSTQATTIQKCVSMGIKYKSHHVKYNKNEDTLTSGQIIMVIRCDTGNYAGTDSTVDSIANKTAFSGLALSWAKHDYYYDN